MKVWMASGTAGEERVGSEDCRLDRRQLQRERDARAWRLGRTDRAGGDRPGDFWQRVWHDAQPHGASGICEALETLTGAIEVRTDSTYVEKCFNQNWHERWLRDGSWKGSNGPVKNRDLWERLFGLVWDGRRDVTFVWIRGHAGDPTTHRVDRLARAAALSAG
jgi:hypothetical protein